MVKVSLITVIMDSNNIIIGIWFIKATKGTSYVTHSSVTLKIKMLSCRTKKFLFSTYASIVDK